jgi:amino acid transporter
MSAEQKERVVAPAAPPRHDVDLARRIGLYAATAITVGNIIGSGIFKSPHSVAQYLDRVPVVIAVWVVGGILSLCGSLALVELAVAYPKTGGLYVFIREGFGDAWAFAFGWANFWVIKPTLIAAITMVFAEYFCDAAGLPHAALLPVGWLTIVLLTGVNVLGVRQGAGTASLFTTLKVLGIAALCAAAFALPHAGAAAGVAPPAAAPAGRPLLLAMALAMIPVLFAYDGWTDVTYVGGEIVEPRRNLPVAILWGTVLVVVVYVVTNLAYFRVLTPAEVAAYPVVGAETMRRILGAWGSHALAVLVAVSTFGTVNGAILTGPRVTLAMAADGLLWRPLAHVDARRSSPDRALWAQALLSCLWLWVARSFEDVSGWFVTTMWLFYGVTIAALFAQRRRERRIPAESGQPSRLSAFRTPLYPLTPILFILVTVAIIASDLSSSGWRAAAGVILAALGFPVYHLWRARKAA